MKTLVGIPGRRAPADAKTRALAGHILESCTLELNGEDAYIGRTTPFKRSHMAAIAFESKPTLDAKDWQLLELLQKDARTGYAELARQVGLSAPAAAERVKRLEDAGVIRGYRAEVDPQRLGYAIEAVIRLRCDGSVCSSIGPALADIPEILDYRRLAGEDSGSLRVIAMSVSHLEAVLDRIVRFHPSISTTTLVVLQTSYSNRPLSRAMWLAGSAAAR